MLLPNALILPATTNIIKHFTALDKKIAFITTLELQFIFVYCFIRLSTAQDNKTKVIKILKNDVQLLYN